MSAQEENRLKELLKQALPPVGTNARNEQDLWPKVLRLLDECIVAQESHERPRSRWIWFDWALVAALVLMAVAFPASIPLLLYYL